MKTTPIPAKVLNIDRLTFGKNKPHFGSIVTVGLIFPIIKISGTVIPALDAIVELTIYLSGRYGYPIAANRRSIFHPLSPHRKTSRRATEVHDARRFVL
jgi:hypothetical protein